LKQVETVTVVGQPTGEDTARGTAPRRGKRTPKIQNFFAKPVEVTDDVIVEIKCPKGQGAAIGGGARTDPGLVLNWLSKAGNDGATPKRSWFVGVEEAGPTEGPRVFAEVQCAKRITVR
jgi:hypothetical protein